MLEFLANPPWWILLILSVAMPKLWDAAVQCLPRLMDHTKGTLRKKWRRLNCKRLRRIKARRFDSVLITREINKSYAFMVLFVLSIMLYGIGLLLIPAPLRATSAGLSFWGISTGLPMLAFEFIWLTSMNRVDDLIHHRGKIRRRNRRLV